MKRSPQLQALTREWAEAGLSDTEYVLRLVDLTQDVLFIGTAPDEFWDGSEMERVAREEYEVMGRNEKTVIRVEAWEHGDTGWSCLDAVEQLLTGPQRLRVTLVWLRTEGEWKAVHGHASLGVANEGVYLPLDALAHAAEVDQPDLSSATALDGTVTLLFTDIESSTEHNQLVGDREWMLILRRHHELIREQVAANGGHEVKSIGDGFMVAFASARRAVRCALDIQHAIAKDDELDIAVRAGLHAGEPQRDDNDFYGATVNMAARVAGAAAGGEILVSSLVKAIVESSGEFAFDPPRTAELKGIPGTQELYPVTV